MYFVWEQYRTTTRTRHPSRRNHHPDGHNITQEQKCLFKKPPPSFTISLMILLSAHTNKPKRDTRHLLTQAHLDGNPKHSTEPNMISIIGYNMHPIPIELPAYTESREQFGWADFPILQCSGDPVDSSPKTEFLNKAKMPKPVESKSQKSSERKHKNASKSLKQVSFSSVHIREHALTVGIHDWCEGDLPITLDWKHAETRSMRVDDFEWIRERQERSPRGRLRKLEYWQRRRILRHVSGIPEEEISNMEQHMIESKYLQLKRSKTVTMFH
jgi:hypothetical protein